MISVYIYIYIYVLPDSTCSAGSWGSRHQLPVDDDNNNNNNNNNNTDHNITNNNHINKQNNNHNATYIHFSMCASSNWGSDHQLPVDGLHAVDEADAEHAADLK